jgi:hypothetical protein
MSHENHTNGTQHLEVEWFRDENHETHQAAGIYYYFMKFGMIRSKTQEHHSLISFTKLELAMSAPPDESNSDASCHSNSFTGKNYYQILGVSPDSSAEIIKKSYRTLALKFHPDRNTSPTAHHDMIMLSKAAETLLDPVKRSDYDANGFVSSDDFDAAGVDVNEAMHFWSSVFKKVTSEDILSFELTYRCSSDELDDLFKSYIKFEGDMNKFVHFFFFFFFFFNMG